MNKDSSKQQRSTPAPPSIWSILSGGGFPFVRIAGKLTTVNPHTADSPERHVAENTDRGGFRHHFHFGSNGRARLYLTLRDVKTRVNWLEVTDPSTGAARETYDGYGHTTAVIAELVVDEAGARARIEYPNPILEVVAGTRVAYEALVASGLTEPTSDAPADAWRRLVRIDLRRAHLPLLARATPARLRAYPRLRERGADLAVKIAALDKLISAARKRIRDTMTADTLVASAGVTDAFALFENLTHVDGGAYDYARRAPAGSGPDQVVVMRPVTRYAIERVDGAPLASLTVDGEVARLLDHKPALRVKEGRGYTYDVSVAASFARKRAELRAKAASLAARVRAIEGAVLLAPGGAPDEFDAGGVRWRVALACAPERTYMERAAAVREGIAYEEMPSKVRLANEFASEVADEAASKTGQ